MNKSIISRGHLANLYKSLLCVFLSVFALAASGTEESEESPFVTPELLVAPPDGEVLGFIDSRNSQSLNGTWILLVDPMGIGQPGGFFGGWTTTREPEDEWQLLEYSYPKGRQIRVPGDFNTQFDDLFFYRDSVWYQRFVDVTPEDGQRYHLWFGGANYTTTVFLNGKALARQVGGYVPFSIDVTEHLKSGANDLVVNVNNRLDADSVPTARTDWWPYGGLTRDVKLLTTAEKYIVNAKVELTSVDGGIEGTVKVRGMNAGDTVSVSVPELDVDVVAKVDRSGIARWKSDAVPELWSPESPRLYEVVFAAAEHQLRDRIGFRTIETRGTELLLNGAPLRFKGISTHEEPIGRDGAAYSRADIETLFTEAKALGANFVRAAHYPYSRHAAQVADEMGLLLWEEVPIYWNIAWENPETLAIARDQISRLVERDWNRASVVIWSVANETPYSKPRMKFLEQLIDHVRDMDDTRLVSAALLGDLRRELQDVAIHLAAYGATEASISPEERAVFLAILQQAGDDAPEPGEKYALVIDDPLGEFVDIVSYNQYFGWYYARAIAPQLGVSEKTVRTLMFKFMHNITLSAGFDKPMHISELGAGAKAGKHGSGVWTEEYQAEVYRAQTAMISNSPQVKGLTPWILKDFRAMLRPLGGIQDFRNRKGLIDENGRRKEAFYVLRDFYAGPWAAGK